MGFSEGVVYTGELVVVGSTLRVLGHRHRELCGFMEEVWREFGEAGWTDYRCAPLRSRYHDPDPISDRERRELGVPDGFGPLVPGVTYEVQSGPMTWFCVHCGSRGEALCGGTPCRNCGARDTELYIQ